MVSEFFRALFVVGVPVGAASFALIWWSLRQGYLGPLSSVKDLEQGIKALSKQQRKDRKQRKAETRETADVSKPTPRIDPVHKKWLAFGGGFYGIVGLLTYAVVELGDLRNFFTSFESLGALLANFGINMLVNLFVDALVNFITAIAWPVYWMGEIAMHHVWIWFGIAYAGYWTGVKLALRRFGRAAPTAP